MHLYSFTYVFMVLGGHLFYSSTSSFKKKSMVQMYLVLASGTVVNENDLKLAWWLKILVSWFLKMMEKEEEMNFIWQ